MSRVNLRPLHRFPESLVAFTFCVLVSVSVLGAQPLSNANGTWTWTITGNSISITFTPHPTNVSCPSIVFVQTVRNIFIDAAGVEMVLPATAMIRTWAYKDNDAAGDQSYVDHLFCEKDPYYNGDDVPQDRRLAGTAGQGSSAGDGSAVTPATMSDPPFLSDASFPPGKERVRFEFETCAVCRSGPNAGQMYGCIKWKYERTKGVPGFGSVSVTSTGVEAESATHITALATFVSNHTVGGVPVCPEDIPTGDCANRVYNRRLPYVWHLNDSYTVGPVDSGITKGHTDPNGSDPLTPPTVFTPITRGDGLVACDWIVGAAGQRICIRRNSDLQGPDPQIPFLATFVDHLGGGIETVEAASCLQAEHCGVRVKNCATGATLAAAAPQDSNDPAALVMYTVEMDELSDSVTFRNDPLSSHNLFAADVLGGSPSPVSLAPGAAVTFIYSGSVNPCALPPGAHGGMPTLSTVGIAVLTLLVTLVGIIVLRRQRRTT